MKNIGHSSNCNMEIYMYLFAPSKPAQNFTLSIHLIFIISSLLIFVIPILKMSPKPKKPTQTSTWVRFFLSQCSSQLYLSQNSFVTNIFFKSSNTMFATYCCHIFYVEKSPQSCTLQYCILQLLGPTSLKKSSCPHPLVPCYNTPSTLLISNSIQSHPIPSSPILSHLIPYNPL